MIVVNGCPKSGTHAVMALLDRMGLKRCPGTILPCGESVHIMGRADFLPLWAAEAIPDNGYMLGHVPAGLGLSGFRVITVFRDPRNVLVSYCRHRQREDNLDVSIADAIADFWGQPFVEVYAGYLGWKGRSVVVRYENLPPDVIGDGGGIYEGHDHDWNTRTGAPSRWQEHWTDEAEAAWVSAGGPELIDRAGYA